MAVWVVVISAALNCIFVHIPKCGGTSIESVLWPGKRSEADLWGGLIDPFRNRHQTGALQHLHAEQIRALVGAGTYDGSFKFSVVRNPFDRAVSQFVYMSKRPRLRTYLGLRIDASFTEYLELVPTVEHVQWEPQFKFLVNSQTGGIMVDRVVRFENLARDMASVFDRLGVAGETLPHLNYGDRDPYREYYSRHDRALIENFYGQDLELFDYDF